MNSRELITYLEKIDANLQNDTLLHIYGSAALMLLGEDIRISLDIDVAAPYSKMNQADVGNAALKAGLPVNPNEFYDRDHLELVGPLRLCLPPPGASDLLLWQGQRLTVKCPCPAILVASKLIRYDETDQSDIHFLVFQTGLQITDIEQAVSLLPTQFREDLMLKDNLQNLRVDFDMWRKTQ